MVKDSVREELALKISPAEKSARVEKEIAEILSNAEKAKAEIWRNTLPPSKREPIIKPTPAPFAEKPAASNTPIAANPPAKINPPVVTNTPPATPILSVTTTKPETMEFVSKPTSPTLIEFQNKNAVLPEWRLQLQNSVRRRTGNTQSEASVPVQRQTVLVTNGTNAMKAEPVPEPAPDTSSNPMLEKALKRIEESRQKFLAEEKAAALSVAPPPVQPKSYPYVVASKPQDSQPRQNAAPPAQNFVTKPKPAAPLTEVKAEKFDTNKLPPLPAKVASSFESRSAEISSIKPEIDLKESKSFKIKAVEEPEVVAYEEPLIEEHEEEMDDRAPLALRFNAALFDLIIGSFISVILLAPFMLASGNLFTVQGLFAFLATLSIVMFIYLTTTIGTMGRTFGMRLFSLELIDIEENAYPTFHQAAVNSSVYLVSLALGGIGFLTLFLNHEKRAAHDLVSGTIVVKEYE
jgi:uncharacterized RDD family membrane protein YckC